MARSEFLNMLGLFFYGGLFHRTALLCWLVYRYQTKEDRQTTVYAIELTLDNKDGKLKPGMPMDMIFASQVAAK